MQSFPTSALYTTLERKESIQKKSTDGKLIHWHLHGVIVSLRKPMPHPAFSLYCQIVAPSHPSLQIGCSQVPTDKLRASPPSFPLDADRICGTYNQVFHLPAAPGARRNASPDHLKDNPSYRQRTARLAIPIMVWRDILTAILQRFSRHYLRKSEVVKNNMCIQVRGIVKVDLETFALTAETPQ